MDPAQSTSQSEMDRASMQLLKIEDALTLFGIAITSPLADAVLGVLSDRERLQAAVSAERERLVLWLRERATEAFPDSEGQDALLSAAEDLAGGQHHKSAWQVGDTFAKIAPFPTGETLVLDKIREDGRLEVSRPSGARQLVPAEMLEQFWKRVGEDS